MLSVVQTFWSVALLPAVSRVWTTLELSSPGSVGTGTGVTGGSESWGSVGRSTQVTVAATSTSTAIPGRRRSLTLASDRRAKAKPRRESRATTRNPAIFTGQGELCGDLIGTRCAVALMGAIGAPPQHCRGRETPSPTAFSRTARLRGANAVHGALCSGVSTRSCAAAAGVYSCEWYWVQRSCRNRPASRKD